MHIRAHGVVTLTVTVIHQANDAQANEGKEVEAQWLRMGGVLTLKLTPQKWNGRGLIGCHLRPL